MGRAERRRSERKGRIEDRKDKLLVSKKHMSDVKQDITNYNVRALMTCFALAERRLYRFGQGRLLKTLQYIDELMGDVIDGKITMEDYARILEEETGIVIK